MGWNGDGAGWMNGGGWVFACFFWILLLGLGILLVTWLTRREKPAEGQESPRQILDRRFTSGDIDSAAYAQARRLLDNRPSGMSETNR